MKITFEPDKPCPFCGENNLSKCKKCKKIICLNCSAYSELPRSKGYICESCLIELRTKKIRGS